MKKKTVFVAVGGVLCALAVAIMFLGTIIPIATFAVPALASLCVLYMVLEFGCGAASLTYITIALLSLLIAPDKEAAMIFIFFFGHYPLLKSLFERRLPPPLCWAAKFACFNAGVISMYLLALKVFMIGTVIDEFSEYGRWFVIVMLALGNFAFFIYDIALTRLISSYLFRWRDRLGAKFGG